jgi:hypothetical protein
VERNSKNVKIVLNLCSETRLLLSLHGGFSRIVFIGSEFYELFQGNRFGRISKLQYVSFRVLMAFGM